MKPRTRLTEWVKQQHQGQLIRRTEQPYFDHLVFVAKKAGAVMPLGYEVGLCHDLLEDTGVTAGDLQQALTAFGYSLSEAEHITGCVTELTDIFTKAAYPGLNKKKRKAKEATRLAGISPGAQTVKYADLIYNIGWVLRYDRKKAAAYFRKKQTLLTIMNQGDPKLRRQALALIARELAG